ncbi:UNVERIFIED_CONTAM: G-type lectin S-receptor-like serine/threonine-protein kinase [Sesamum radiatum]|uniref:Receptor-like serine/threonine-protein kinase n=1 Tax=Sesamum radiatum TaxID=300843 RepID=A0AAW2KJ01_SESRA
MVQEVSKQTVVWVANRETPVLDKNSAQLKILDGNLVLLNESQTKIWSTDTNSTALDVVAVLLDDGNLVLRDGSESNSSIGQPLWESFDNPADTWLPGGKIAYNKRTRTKQLLTSWSNSEDPAPGLFSLELDPDGRQYIIRWNRSEQYWTSGAWNGHIFSLVPEMRLNYIYNFSYMDNDNESYFTYSLYNPSIISRFIMDVSGQIKQLSWDNSDWNLFWSQPRQQCEVYSYCGAFGTCNQNSLPFCDCLPGFKHKSESDWNLRDYSGGCVRETNLQCGNNSTNSNGRRDKFFVRPYMILPDNSQLMTVGSAGECESACLNNCSCTAYAYDGNQCSLWNGELLNLQQLNEGDGNGKTIYIRLSASSSVFSGAKKSKGAIIGAILGSIAVIVLLVAIVTVVIWRRRRQTVGSSKPVEGSLVAFAYKDLQNATKNFSEKLGGGGFGSVFKGTLPDSSVIAVKKLESISQGEKQFRMEVSTIGTIQHVNLVRLRGFCSEGSKKLLVYDYMENSSLNSHLFHANESKVLEWRTRYEIALGVARGLSYLHEKCRDCIIHCDIKPENILLDAEFCPKVADFGLAKLVGRDFSRVLTTMRGTRGYLAPEWISGVAITAKADVYSYGMMLFELVSGRRNSENSEDGKVKFYPAFAARVTVDGGDVLGLLDPLLDGNADVEEVLKVCKVASWCIQDDENTRPSMGQVVQILEGLMDVNLPPVPRSLQVFVESEEHIIFFTDSSSADQSSQTKSNTSSASAHSKTSTSSAN